MIILKNMNGRAIVDTVFRGKKVILRPKCTLVLDDTEEGKAEAQFIKSTYGFVIDVTDLLIPKEVDSEKQNSKK